jgi:hypothetical protein
MRLPAAVFQIPSNCEIDAGTGVLLMVPPFDVALFSEHLTNLSNSPVTRERLGALGAKVVEDRFRVEKNMQRALQKISSMTHRTRSVSTL